MLRAAAIVAAVVVAGVACSPADRREAREEIRTGGAVAEARLEDAAVTAAVKSKLLADQIVSGMRIDVDTRDGIVTLTGSVTTAAANDRANELARATEGVLRVEDRLTVAR